MNAVTLGRHGPTVTPLGLGLAALGRPGYITIGHEADLGGEFAVDAMAQRAHDVLDTAFAAGMRYVDAARSYGRAEDFVASWLDARGHEPGTVTVGSKWGYEYTADWTVDAAVHEKKNHSVEHLRHQWEESTRRLGDHLALYQVHSATFDSGVLEDRAVLDTLAAIREQGTTIGVTVSGPLQRDLVHRSMEIEYDGHFLFESVQATWNLIERSAQPALEDAAHEGIGVIVKEALANGRLTERNHDRRDGDLIEALADTADAAGTTFDAAALAAALAQPWAHVVLSGVADADHLRANVRALDVNWTDRFTRRFEDQAEAPDVYWKRRSSLGWN